MLEILEDENLVEKEEGEEEEEKMEEIVDEVDVVTWVLGGKSVEGVVEMLEDEKLMVERRCRRRRLKDIVSGDIGGGAHA